MRPKGSPAAVKPMSRKTPATAKASAVQVAQVPQPEKRHRDGGGEFDPATVASGKTGDRQIEADIHGRQNEAEQQDEATGSRRRFAERPQWAAPEGEQSGGGRDAEPGDALRRQLGEQQHGEGRPQIMEDRADQEIDMWRQPLC